MIDHTGVTVSDFKKNKLFYENALKPIGYKMVMELPKEHTGGAGVCGYAEALKPDFWISEGIPNKPHVHVAFRVDSQKKDDEFYSAAIAAGAKDNGKPGPRPHYHENYRGTFVLVKDPEGYVWSFGDCNPWVKK